MKAIRKSTLVEQAGEAIKRHIEQHRLRPGQKLPSEREWVESLQVSRTAVREALKSLELVGVVRLKPGDGIYVSDPSLRHITRHVTFQWKTDKRKLKELLEIRKILELGAVELAVGHRDSEAIGDMARWVERMEAKVKKRLPAVEEDLAFHRALFRATGNETMLQFSEMLAEFFPESHEEPCTETTLNEHREIYDRLKQGDAPGARRVLEAHLDSLKTTL